MVARQILVPLLIFGCILGFLTVQARPTPKVNPINQAYKQALSDNVARRKGLYEEKGDSKGPGGERTRYIVKLVDITSKEGESVASCEPHALDQVNIWHRTGIRKVEGEKFGAILMKLEAGEDISENKMWLQANRTERHTVLEAIKVKTREKVYKYAFETQLI
ncbi:hypothetical protein EV361DRAFT_1031059 [Lentinula raphanica]|nr:hypothetical protein EV361DRAFT_1031059 [Lentinula raphanica]